MINSTHMKIILEGVDGSGKTTLANQIIKKFPDLNFKLVHLTRETPNNKEYFEKLLLSQENIIFDRFHIGQFIYQSESERVSKGWMSNKDLEDLEDFINHMKAIVKIIYVDTPTDTCLINCKKDAEDFHYTEDYIELLKKRYKSFIEKSKNDIMVYKNDFKAIDPDLSLKFKFSDLPYIIGVDYDGVLAVDSYPDLAKTEMNEELINDLVTQQRLGTKIILWTCRTGKALAVAIEACHKKGLDFDAVNENLPELVNAGLNPRKIYCNEYIDDHARYIKFGGTENAED